MTDAPAPLPQPKDEARPTDWQQLRWLPWLTIPFLLACLWPVGFYLSRCWRTPSDSDHAALASAVRQEFREGDVLIASPWYMQKPYVRLGDLPFLVLRKLHRDDLLGYRRVHLIELPTAVGEGIADELRKRETPRLDRRFGPLRYQLFPVTLNERPVFDFLAQLDKARVMAHYHGTLPVHCSKWEAEKWLCPRDPDWNFVGREYLDYDDVPRRLIWAHPLADRGQLHILFSDVPLTGAIVGSHAFTRWAATRAQTPIELAILVDGRPLTRQVLPVGKGLARFRVPLPSSGQRGSVEFVIGTQNNASAHYGFTAMVVAQEQP